MRTQAEVELDRYTEKLEAQEEAWNTEGEMQAIDVMEEAIDTINSIADKYGIELNSNDLHMILSSALVAIVVGGEI